MSKKNLIKDIKDIEEFNILCENLEQVKECFDILKNLNFEIDYGFFINKKKYLFVSFEEYDGIFYNKDTLIKNKSISFYNFKQETKKFLTSANNTQVEDIKYDKKTGRVLAINNWDTDIILYRVFHVTSIHRIEIIQNCFKDMIEKNIKLGLLYISKETCEKAEQEMIKRVEEENKKIGAKC